MIAILIGIVLFQLALTWTGNRTGEERNRFEDWENQKNAVYWIDNLIKNRNVEHPELGSAYYDPAKHRVESNIMDHELLSQIQFESQALPVQIRELELDYWNGTTETILGTENENRTCVWLERMVLVNNQKALVRAGVCHD